MASTRIFADDTTLPVLDPGRGRTKTGRLWGYAIDDRPWGGSTPPAVVYLYAEDRKGEHPAAHLAEFRGVLQVDGYGGFKSLLENRPPGEIRLAFCWAHCRRRFYEIHQATGSPLAEEALRRIGELYAIEAEIRGRPAEERRAVRQERSKPIVDALHAWLTAQLGRVSGKSGLAEAIRYALRHWQGLVLFLDDGRLELDTNTVERAIRPIALGRKNSLFAGSDGGARHWAIVASLVATAKLNGVEPLAWLTDVLERDGLGPDQGARARAAAAVDLEGRAGRGRSEGGGMTPQPRRRALSLEELELWLASDRAPAKGGWNVSAVDGLIAGIVAGPEPVEPAGMDAADLRRAAARRGRRRRPPGRARPPRRGREGSWPRRRPATRRCSCAPTRVSSSPGTGRPASSPRSGCGSRPGGRCSRRPRPAARCCRSWSTSRLPVSRATSPRCRRRPGGTSPGRTTTSRPRSPPFTICTGPPPSGARSRRH